MDLPRRIDGLLGLMPVEGQKEVRQLVGLFENALTGLLFDGQLKTFTASSHEQQDARIRGWQKSRLEVRRTGFRALKKIVYSSYYGARETWSAIGYPGPPRPAGWWSASRVSPPARSPRGRRRRRWRRPCPHPR